MLEEGDIDNLIVLLEKRQRFISRLEGMYHSLSSGATRQAKALQASVSRIEETLREDYGLQIETEFGE